MIENGGQKQHEENEVGEMTMGMKRRTRSTNNRKSEFGDVRGPTRKAREDCRGGCRLVSSLPWMIKKNQKRYGDVEGHTDRDNGESLRGIDEERRTKRIVEGQARSPTVMVGRAGR